VFNDILGAQKYSGRVLPKIPYGTKAVKKPNNQSPISDFVPKDPK